MHIDSLVRAGGHGSRVVFTPGNRWAVDYIMRQMGRSSRQVYADTFRVKRSRRSSGEEEVLNAVAIIPGKSDSILVIGGHLDASASRDPGWNRNWRTMPAPGADDNATGIAVILEVLALAAHAPSQPSYTLMFVGFNAEEKHPDYAGHHLGSRSIAERLKREGRPVKGVIVLDMVGWNPRGDYMPLFASPRSQWLARELVAHNEWLRLSLDLSDRFPPCRNSDNESFDRLGIPAVLFMESCTPWRNEPRHPRNPGYHTGRDTEGMVTYSLVDKVTRLVAAYAMK